MTDDTRWLVSKIVSDKLRAHLLAQGIDGILANNTAVFNVLQEHGMLQPTPEGKAIWKATVTSDRLITQLHPAASGFGLDLGGQRTASSVCGDDGGDRGDD